MKLFIFIFSLRKAFVIMTMQKNERFLTNSFNCRLRNSLLISEQNLLKRTIRNTVNNRPAHLVYLEILDEGGPLRLS